MKGKILKTDSGWVVRKELVDYPLHPTDIAKINEWEQMFDHIEGRIASAPDVNFRLLGLIKCACRCHIGGAKIRHVAACCHNGYKGPKYAKLDNI